MFYRQYALGMSWETVKAEPMDLPRDVQVDCSKLPLTTNEEGEQVLRMYWFDAYEDYFKQPGGRVDLSKENKLCVYFE